MFVEILFLNVELYKNHINLEFYIPEALDVS